MSDGVLTRRRRWRLGRVMVGVVVALTAGTPTVAGAVPTATAPTPAVSVRDRDAAPVPSATGVPTIPRAAAPTIDDSLSGVSCRSLSRCWAVGYAGSNPSSGGTLAERWSRTSERWVRVPSPSARGADESNLNDVSCVSSSSCMAVGAKETASLHISTLAERWNGRRWLSVVTPHLPGHPSSLFWGVSCTGTNNCWAVGSYVTSRAEGHTHSLIERWNGSAWSVVASPSRFDSSALYHVSCATATSCLAVGIYTEDPFGYGLTEHWNGSVWSAVFARRTVTTESSELDGASCAADVSCLAVGNYALEDPTSTLRTLDAQWTGPDTVTQSFPANPSPTVGSQLIGVSCLGPSTCVAVGDEVFSGSHVKTLAERWNGSAWSIVSTPPAYRSRDIELLDVSCATSTDCFAVGVDFGHPDVTTLAERWNGTIWKVVPSANP